MNPLKLNDIFRANIRLIRGSNPTGSIALVCYVTEFAATAAFSGRSKIYNGTPSEILDAMEADGFVATDRAYLHAAAFTSIDTPIDEIMIGRRDAGDASWTATLDAIEAEDDSFGLFIVDMVSDFCGLGICQSVVCLRSPPQCPVFPLRTAYQHGSFCS